MSFQITVYDYELAESQLRAMNDSVEIHSMLWMMAQGFISRYEWRRGNPLHAMNDRRRDSFQATNDGEEIHYLLWIMGAEIHYMPWMTAQRFTSRCDDVEEIHSMLWMRGVEIHFRQWMIVKWFTPCHEWWRRDSFQATNDGEEINSMPWMVGRDSFHGMNDAKRFTPRYYVAKRFTPCHE
jgi:hypothetical protein